MSHQYHDGHDIDFNPRVAVWVEAGSDWLFEAECPLAECFPDRDDEEFVWAATWLHTHDSYTTGGGAAPVFKLVRI